MKISISRFLFFIYTYKHTCDLLLEEDGREGETIAKKDVEDKDRTTTIRTRVTIFV